MKCRLAHLLSIEALQVLSPPSPKIHILTFVGRSLSPAFPVNTNNKMMKPCFVASTPLTTPRTSGWNSVQARRTVCARTVRMSAESGNGEKQSLGDWLLAKFMHNNEEIHGYEPYHKVAMTAREEEQKKIYSGKDTTSGSQ